MSYTKCTFSQQLVGLFPNCISVGYKEYKPMLKTIFLVYEYIICYLCLLKYNNTHSIHNIVAHKSDLSIHWQIKGEY